MKKLLAIMNETTVSGSIAPGPAVGLGTQRRVQEEDSDDGTKAPDAPKAKEFGLWKNSVLAGAEQRDKKKSKKVAESKSEERNEMDDPNDLTIDQLAVLGKKLSRPVKDVPSPIKSIRHKDGYTEFSGIDKEILRNKKPNTRKHPTNEKPKVDERDYGAGQRQLRLAEENISEEQLLAKELARRLDLFMKGLDRELGKKSSDRGIQSKTEPSTGAMREDHKTIGPDMTDPYEQGWRAGHRGDFDCPYKMGTEEYEQWQTGFEEADAQRGHYNESVTEDAFQTQQLIQRHADMLGQSAAQLTQGDLDQLTQLGFSIGIGAAAGVAGVIGGYELGDRFISLINKTMRMIKKKAEVDTEEIIQLQRQIVSIHKRLKTLKSEPAIAKYQAMLKQAYEVLAELESRQGNQVAEDDQKQLSVQQLATISDEALDNAYHYGRSSPGNTFGWQANLKSAAYAKQMIDKDITDIEAISDAIHKGWNVTAKAFVQNPDQFDDTEKLKAAGKLEAKLQQREKLMNIGYAQLPDEEQEKDRVVARALLQALKGQQDVAEDSKGLWANIHAKQNRIKNGSGERMRKPGSKGAPTNANFKSASKTEGVEETTGDSKFDKMLKDITGKKVVAKQQKADTKQQSRDAFSSMFGGGNPADSLSIRKKGVSETTGDTSFDSMMGKIVKGARYKGAAADQRADTAYGSMMNNITKNAADVAKPSANSKFEQVYSAVERILLSNNVHWDIDDDILDALKKLKIKASDALMQKLERELINRVSDALQYYDDSDLAEQAVSEDSDPCWDNYKQVGMKKKNGKKVPNCVPKKGVAEGLESDKKILRLFTFGKSPEQIADELNIDIDTVTDYIKNRMPQSQDNRSRGYSSERNVSQGMNEQGVTEDAASVKYGVFSKGGSVGDQKWKNDPIKTFDNKEKAIAFAKHRRASLSKGEKAYYRMSYVVKPIKNTTEKQVNEHGDPWEDPDYEPYGSGKETRSSEQIAKDRAEHAILSKKLGLSNKRDKDSMIGDMTKMLNHFMGQHSKKKDVDEASASSSRSRAGLAKLAKLKSMTLDQQKEYLQKQLEISDKRRQARDDKQRAEYDKKMALKSQLKDKDDSKKGVSEGYKDYKAPYNRGRDDIDNEWDGEADRREEEYEKSQQERKSNKERDATSNEFTGTLDSKDRFTKGTVKKMFGKLSPDAKDVNEATGYKSQFPSAAPAIQYAKDKVKTFRDPDDGIEIWSMPDGGCDVVHTSNSNGRNHCIDNRGKKLGTIRPQKQGNK
jgi:hypothetical protein